MFQFDDRVLENTSTIGTGAYALGGAVSSAHFAFSAVIANGDQVPYFAYDDNNVEIGIGTYNSGGNTLARTTIKRSSNANAAVNWGTGTRKIGINIPAFLARKLIPRRRTVSIKVISDTTPLTTGDGKAKLTIPEEIDGWKLAHVGMHCYVASTSGTVSVQLHNATAAVDMLSVNVTLAATKKDTAESGNTPPTINPSNAVVSEGDELRFDVDGAGANVQGLEVRLQFEEVIT